MALQGGFVALSINLKLIMLNRMVHCTGDGCKRQRNSKRYSKAKFMTWIHRTSVSRTITIPYSISEAKNVGLLAASEVFAEDDNEDDVSSLSQKRK